MASISDFGIVFVLPMAALAASSGSVAAPAHSPPTSDIQIEIGGLRNAHGLVRMCLTRDPKAFPDCKAPGDLHVAVHASVKPLRYTFRALPAGTYALAAFHDANGNGKLDTMMGIPREGFAFSRNPAIRARAPRLDETSFENNGRALPSLKMKYLL